MINAVQFVIRMYSSILLGKLICFF